MEELQVVHPFGIDPLAVSRLFMHEDLAKSGLTVNDFPHPPVPVAAVGGRGCYQMWYNKEYYKLKIDREHDKYIGPKGTVPPVVVLGTHYGAPVTASVEGLKKALAFFVSTGIPTICIDSCWAFGESVDSDAELKVKDLHSSIMMQLQPGQSHLVLFDGDWSTNDQVRLALSAYRMLLDEQGVKLRFKDLGALGGRRAGYDDWLVATYGADRTLWPTQAEVLTHIITQVSDIPNEELLGGAQAFALNSLDRFSTAYLDLTDRGAGSLMCKLLGAENFKYCRDTKDWIIWETKPNATTDDTGGKWENVGELPLWFVDSAARYYMTRAKVLSAQATKMEGNTDMATRMAGLLKQAAKFARFGDTHCSSTAGRTAVLNDMRQRRELWVFLDSFDSNPNLLAVQNGVVDLRTGMLREERQEDYILRRCPVAYTGEEPTGEAVNRIKRFLREITSVAHGVEDLVALEYLQRRLGASIRGKNSLTALELWNGGGANGKTVLSNLLQHALGDTDNGGYACSTNANVLMSTMKTRDAESSTPFLIKLIGARLVFMAESKDTDHMNEAFVKQLVGGDKITARANYQDGKSYDVTFSPVLLTNNLPAINEGGDGLWDRMAITEFSCRWRRAHKVLVTEADAELPLADTWFEDIAPGLVEVQQWFIWWLVEGCRKWFAEGLSAAPERSTRAVEAYQVSNDRYSDWMAECGWCFDPGALTLTRELYQSFANHMHVTGGKAPIDKVFGKRLLERFPALKVVKYKGLRHMEGIRLIEQR